VKAILSLIRIILLAVSILAQADHVLAQACERQKVKNTDILNAVSKSSFDIDSELDLFSALVWRHGASKAVVSLTYEDNFEFKIEAEIACDGTIRLKKSDDNYRCLPTVD
jgi:hypothetical protein